MLDRQGHYRPDHLGPCNVGHPDHRKRPRHNKGLLGQRRQDRLDHCTPDHLGQRNKDHQDRHTLCNYTRFAKRRAD
jgi:hypothetical protein